MPSEHPLISSFGHRQPSVVSPFRPGSIFYNDPTASSIDNNINNNNNSIRSSDSSLLLPKESPSSSSSLSSNTNDTNTDCPPSLLSSNSTPSANKKHRAFLSTHDPAAVSLASPPPSPSRNSIFDQPWSSLSGPNISSLRASSTPPSLGTTESVSSIPTKSTTTATTPIHSPLAPRPLKYHYTAAAATARTAPSSPSTYSSKIHLHKNRSFASDASTTTGAGAGVTDADEASLCKFSPVCWVGVFFFFSLAVAFFLCSLLDSAFVCAANVVLSLLLLWYQLSIHPSKWRMTKDSLPFYLSAKGQRTHHSTFFYFRFGL
ncbi:hypothetical protein K457DRAFT_876610 [Linnemannia elongata AG-77]|uniref:Uncharacterized protein n=1 Tax=Linnemannia elongata AG-77 TaxID=1314771 RepID=A0A197JFP1_9FUNG|nr:hypothetical protein K457DRAFT_876610 [Linnemannia elongata AG-77]